MSFIESFLFAVKEHLGNETTSITTASGLTSTRTWSLECASLSGKFYLQGTVLPVVHLLQGERYNQKKEGKKNFISHVIWGSVIHPHCVFVLLLQENEIFQLLAFYWPNGEKKKKRIFYLQYWIYHAIQIYSSS